MTTRDALGLDDAELAQFLRDEVGSGAEIVVAAPGVDGYPEVALVAARHLAAGEVAGDGEEPAAIEFTDPEPVDDVPLCAIVERGETYDDIRAVIIRGVVRHRRLAMDDVVSFAFAKLRQ